MDLLRILVILHFLGTHKVIELITSYMKEPYFTEQNLVSATTNILNNVKQYSGRGSIDLNINRSALLVVDMQNFFLSSDSHAFVPSAEAIIPGINKLIKIYEDKSLPIIFTRHSNTPENIGMMDYKWRRMLLNDTYYFEISKQIIRNSGYIIDKNQYDVFFQSNFEDLLKELHIQEIVVCGVLTHLCCETTVRSLFVRGYKVFFPIDTTATYNQQFHESTFINLSNGFIEPVLSTDLFSQTI